MKKPAGERLEMVRRWLAASASVDDRALGRMLQNWLSDPRIEVRTHTFSDRVEVRGLNEAEIARMKVVCDAFGFTYYMPGFGMRTRYDSAGRMIKEVDQNG